MKNLKTLFMLIMIVSLIFLTGCNEKHVHNYKEIIIEPTCAQKGYNIKICECGDNLIEKEVSPSHNYEEVIIEPTCTQNGYIIKRCECGDNFIEKELFPKGHTLGDWIIVKEATKETNGLQEKKCSDCEYKEEEIITYNYDEYLDYSFDENIAVVTQVIEKRKNSNQTDTGYEESVYDFYFYIKKTSTLDLNDIFVSIVVKTENGIKYVKSTSGRNLEGATTILSTISITNSSAGDFAVNEVTKEGDAVKHIDKIPQIVYVSVSYDKVVERQDVACELNYKFEYDDVTKESFDDYEQRNIIVSSNNTTQYVEYKNDYVSMKFLKIPVVTSSDTVKYSEYRLSNVKIVKNNLPANTSISKIKIEVFAEIGNEAMITKDYFSKYVKLFVYEGALAADITNSRTSSLADEYNVEKVYFNVEIELSNGDSANYKFYVLTSDLLEK